jgi:hypothetical protein
MGSSWQGGKHLAAMYASYGLHLVVFFCSYKKIGYSTGSQQFSGLLTSGFSLDIYTGL